MFLKTSEQTILRSLNLYILLCFFASITVCTVFAEESSPRKVTSTEVMPIDSMATTKDFETKLTAPCEDLHNAATSEEFRAVTLEATAKESRSISEKAKNEYLTLQQTLEALPAYLGSFSKNKISEHKSSKTRGASQLIWVSTNILLRQLVPREVRNRKENKKEVDQSAASQPQSKVSIPREEFAAPLMSKTAQARKEAEETAAAAETAEGAARKARTAADEAHLAYDKCIGK